MPRRLGLLLTGIVLGAGGVLFLQTNYGPQRLTVEQSEQLHTELNATNLELQQLYSQLEDTTQQRDANKTLHDKLISDLAQAEHKIDDLNKKLALFQEAMPPDPRGGLISVRSASFNKLPRQLHYQALIMRDNAHDPLFQGALELSIEGRYGDGRVETLTSQPIAITVNRYDRAEGNVPLPDGFQPRNAVIKVFDTTQKQQAMRIYNLQGLNTAAQR
jgi:hypothetical protein